MAQVPVNELRLTAIGNTLRACRLFAGLPPEDVRGVSELCVLKRLAKNEHLFRQGDPSHGFYVVQQGSVSVHRVSATGKEHVIHVFRPGDSFAEASLSMDAGYPADARAIEASQVLLVKREEFVGLFKRRPELALRMLAAMSQHLRDLVTRVEDLTLKDVETRLANWLVRRCPSPTSTKPHAIELSITKRDLAAELGTVSETFSRTLGKFREQGLLTVRGKTLTLSSPARLVALLRRNLGEPDQGQ